MKNKLISQKTRSRASKVVLALFLCTIMISSLCSFTVGDAFTYPETPPEYDYQSYTMNEGETDEQFLERVLSYGSYTVYDTQYSISITTSVPFYYLESGNTILGYVTTVQGVYGMGYYTDAAGISYVLESYTNNEYTVSFLEALGLDTPPTPTESFTNVWDGILNWITTSISSLQNVFWQEGTVIDLNSDVDTTFAITINDTVLYRSDYASPADGYDFYVDGHFVDPDSIVVNSIVIGSTDYHYLTYNDDVLCAINSVNGGVFTNTDVDYYVTYGDPPGLTLLGTLCCIAVAISVVFLLIGMIVNFLKLRS